MGEFDNIKKEHGVDYLGRPMSDLERYTGPIEPVSDEESIRRDHGVGYIGKPVDSLQTWGTRDDDLKKTLNQLIHASQVFDISGVMEKLPEDSVRILIEQRFRRNASKLDDGFGSFGNVQELASQVESDLTIIMAALKAGHHPKINTSYYVGDTNMNDISDLLNIYKEKLSNTKVMALQEIADKISPLINSNALDEFKIAKAAYDEVVREELAAKVNGGPIAKL